MKKILLLLAAVLLLVACDDYKNIPQGNTDEYYVRYTIKSSWYVFGNVTYADVHGTADALTNQKVNSWTVTIGPVKKGFSAWSKNSLGTSTNSAIHTIEISKNGGPFAQKATGTNSASYKINY